MSDRTTVRRTGQRMRARLDSGLSIFFPLLALDAEACVRERVEAVERDFLSAIVAPAEVFRLLVQSAERLVDVPEEPAFLAREEKSLFTLHGVRSLVRHVERIRTQVTVSGLGRGTEDIFVMPQLLQRATTLVQQPLFKVLEVLFGHRFRLFNAVRIGHLNGPL